MFGLFKKNNKSTNLGPVYMNAKSPDKGRPTPTLTKVDLSKVAEDKLRDELKRREYLRAQDSVGAVIDDVGNLLVPISEEIRKLTNKVTSFKLNAVVRVSSRAFREGPKFKVNWYTEVKEDEVLPEACNHAAFKEHKDRIDQLCRQFESTVAFLAHKHNREKGYIASLLDLPFR